MISTVGTNILGDSLHLLQSLIILLIGAILVIISVMTKYHIPTAFTIIEAVIGSGLVFGNEIRWFTLQIILG